MHVSYAELVRIGTEAIRMTGFTFGQADDALEGIVWSQCVLGRGYHLLRMADRVRQTQAWPSHSVTSVRPGRVAVDLTGSPAFGFAARLADLAIATAAEPGGGGFGTVEVSGAFGGWIAPYIACRLARARHHAAVLWKPDPCTPSAEAPATLVVAAASTGEMTPLLITPAEAYALNKWTEESRCLEPRVPRRLLESVVRTASRNSDVSVLLIETTPSAGPEGSIDLASALEVAGAAAVSGGAPMVLDGSGALRRAIERGIEAATEDHDAFIALSHRIRLPNTERSKSQAG